MFVMFQDSDTGNLVHIINKKHPGCQSRHVANLSAYTTNKKAMYL